MTPFKAMWDEHLDKLDLYVPVVDRVHGDSHPEFHEVKKRFNLMREKLLADPSGDLSQDFEILRDITSYYFVPDDVCETYEAVYQMLHDLDKAWQSSR